MVPLRKIDVDVLKALSGIKSGLSLQHLMCAYIIIVLKRNNGNRTRTSKEIGMPLRTFRSRLWVLESLGYEVPKYQRQTKSKKV